MKKVFCLCASIFLILVCMSCQNPSTKIKGRWASVQTGAIYDFSGKTFVLNTSVLNSAVMAKGSYRCTKNSLTTVVERLSFDFGETWEKNDGSLIPAQEVQRPLKFIAPDKIVLSDAEYVRF